MKIINRLESYCSVFGCSYQSLGKKTLLAVLNKVKHKKAYILHLNLYIGGRKVQADKSTAKKIVWAYRQGLIECHNDSGFIRLSKEGERFYYENNR